MRRGKLYRHIGTAECLRIEILRIVNINDAYNFVSSAQRNLLNHTAHLAVTNQCYFHIHLCFCLAKIGI